MGKDFRKGGALKKKETRSSELSLESAAAWLAKRNKVQKALKKTAGTTGRLRKNPGRENTVG